MENSSTGYRVQEHGRPVKRYCQTLDLKNDPELITRYKRYHSSQEIWPEIIMGIRQVGTLEMEIYIRGTRLFMIVETAVDFDWDSAMKTLNTLPRQKEWEEFMSIFQQPESGSSSSEKWKLMNRIFHL